MKTLQIILSYLFWVAIIFNEWFIALVFAVAGTILTYIFED